MTTRMTPGLGGSTSLVFGLLQALPEQSVEVGLVTTRLIEQQGTQPEYSWPTSSFREGRISKLWTGYAPGVVQHLAADIENYDLVHVHELWHFPHFAAVRAAKKSSKPYVVSPDGALSSWAMGHKAWKKRIYWRAIQKRALQHAAVIHSQSDVETGHVRRLGLNTPVCLVPNGIEASMYNDLPSAEPFIRSHPELAGKQIVLFLGRLHPIKGLDLLASAFGRVAQKRSDAWLVIAGPDNDGYRQKLEVLLRAENALSRTTFTGLITGREKLEALASSCMMVLPSYSEAQSIAVIEGMASGLPVVATHTCGVPELADADGGFLINPDPHELTTALDRLLGDEALRLRMGRNARRLAHASYSWRQAAARMASLYRHAIAAHAESYPTG